jgi:FMN reductase (NADPH)/FMN reductase [NAD(P)H]
MNEVLRLIEERTSVRSFADRPVSNEDLAALLHSAVRAPTAGNMMLYSIVHVGEPDKKRRLAETCGHTFIASAPLVLVFLADMQRWVDYFERFGVPEYCEQEGIPFRLPDSGKFVMACCDALIAAQTTVLAAESLGMGSCYVGDIVAHREEHSSLLRLPRWAFPAAMLCYGYPSDEVERRPRKRFAVKHIVHRDVYQRLGRAEYEEMMRPIRERFAGILHRKGLTLPQLTYHSFMSGDGAIEAARSAQAYMKEWMKR